MNDADRKRITKKLAKEHACYVLITCENPNDDGNLQVEMTYEGDAALASYLIQGAQMIIDEQEESCGQEPKDSKDKIVTFNE